MHAANIILGMMEWIICFCVFIQEREQRSGNDASRGKNNTWEFTHIDVLFKPTIQKIQHLQGWQVAYNGYWYRDEGIINAIRDYSQG